MFTVYRSEESRLGSFQTGGSQAVFVFQVTEVSAYPFQLTVDKLEQALLGAKIEVRREQGLQGGHCHPGKGLSMDTLV